MPGSQHKLPRPIRNLNFGDLVELRAYFYHFSVISTAKSAKSPVFNSLYWTEYGLALDLQPLREMQQGLLVRAKRIRLGLMLQPKSFGED